jgi:dTDP-4-amino-4,6-dideoxygalactose transaminase
MSSHDLQKEQAKNVDKVGDKARQVLSNDEAEVKQLEEKLADYCGVKHAIACSSGADALLLALMSYGVEPGDAIFTSPFTDITAVSAIRLLGATPVFVDIDQSTFNLDPEQLEMAVSALLKRDPSVYPLPGDGSAASLEPKGIISVDLFGLPADYDAIQAIAAKYHLFVIEDGLQAFGGVYKGRRVGSLADIGCTSFSPEAPLGSDGGGGMCLTDHDHLAERMRSVRAQGEERGGSQVVGGMDSLKAAALLAKFGILPEEIRLRQEVAKLYTKYLDENPLLVTPYVPKEVLPVWARYSLLTESDEERSALIRKLKNASIPVAIYYPKPLYLQEDFSYLHYREGDFPISDDYATRIFSIPLHPYLTAKDQEEVADLLNDW